ncbi:hypothetical protein EYM_00585 [Ignicoccus islandicus DSM 13165]|uniref:Uncharacterized protein n=1 Tax=Ignicoccus islandicus DSM 13165 TaxID=940295 RepID=A0A0U3DX92_9CREN|nr:hypothetical protein EYM_00585 [Ignicoccus islandicus DSM 13165]
MSLPSRKYVRKIAFWIIIAKPIGIISIEFS